MADVVLSDFTRGRRIKKGQGCEARLNQAPDTDIANRIQRAFGAALLPMRGSPTHFGRATRPRTAVAKCTRRLAIGQ